MADTPFSATFNPSTWNSGDVVWTPGDFSAGTRGIVRNIKVVNTDYGRDAWLWVGDLSTNTIEDKLINGLYCPAGSTQIIELDYVGSDSAGTGLALRQVADQSVSNMTVTSAVAAVASGTDTTSYATSSWSSAANTYYIMTLSWAGGTSVSSFTDTHSGITWTLLQSDTVIFSTHRMSQYIAKATGTTNTTTTVNFSGTTTSCFMSIVALNNLGDESALEVISPAGTRPYAGLASSFPVTGMEASEMCGGRLLSVFSAENTGSNFSPWGDFIEIHDNEIVSENNKNAVFYSKNPGKSGYAYKGNPPGTASNPDQIAMMVDIHDTYTPLWVTIDGVEE